MSVDLLLINPGGNVYQGLADELTAVEPPLWCRLLAGYVRDRGFSVEIMEGFSHVPEVPRLAVVVAHGHQPSASAQQMDDAIRAAKILERHTPTYVVGGAAPYQSEVPFLRGEAAQAIVELLEGKPVTENPPLVDMKCFHGDVWDMLPMHRYRAHNWQCFDGSPRKPYAAIMTSLGCPYACSFCCINAPFGGRGYRTRLAKAVVAEVEMLYRQYSVSTFKITDEMFVLNPKHYLPICEGLAALPFADELNIWAYARIDTVKDDTLALMRKAGIRWLALGIESGSAHVRDGAKKHIDESEIGRVVRAIQKAGINVIGNFMFGLPDDTRESMQATLDLALDLKCEFANFYCAMAYPGSKLHDETPAGHLPRTWSGYSQHSYDCAPLPTETLTSAEVLAFRDMAFDRYFADLDYLDTVRKKFGDKALKEIQDMAKYRLPRQLLEAA